MIESPPDSSQGMPAPKSGSGTLWSYSGNIWNQISDESDAELKLMNQVAYHFANSLFDVGCSSSFAEFLQSAYDTTDGEEYGFLNFHELYSSYTGWGDINQYFTNLGTSYPDFRDSLADIDYQVAFYIPNFSNCNWSNDPLILVGAEIDTSDYDNFIPGWEPGAVANMEIQMKSCSSLLKIYCPILPQ